MSKGFPPILRARVGNNEVLAKGEEAIQEVGESFRFLIKCAAVALLIVALAAATRILWSMLV